MGTAQTVEGADTEPEQADADAESIPAAHPALSSALTAVARLKEALRRRAAASQIEEPRPPPATGTEPDRGSLPSPESEPPVDEAEAVADSLGERPNSASSAAVPRQLPPRDEVVRRPLSTKSFGMQTDGDAMGAAIHAAMTEREAARACAETVCSGVDSLRAAANRAGAVQVLAALDVITSELDEVLSMLPASAVAVASCFRHRVMHADRNQRGAHNRHRIVTAPGGRKRADVGGGRSGGAGAGPGGVTPWSPTRNSPSPPPPPMTPTECDNWPQIAKGSSAPPCGDAHRPAAPDTEPPARLPPPTRRGLRVFAAPPPAETMPGSGREAGRASSSRAGRTAHSFGARIPARALVAASRRANRSPPPRGAVKSPRAGAENSLASSPPHAATAGAHREVGMPGVPGGFKSMQSSQLAARVREHHLAREAALAERRRRHQRAVGARAVAPRRFSVPRPPTE